MAMTTHTFGDPDGPARCAELVRSLLTARVSLVHFTFPRSVLIEFGKLADSESDPGVIRGEATLDSWSSWMLRSEDEDDWHFNAHTGDETEALARLSPFVGRRVVKVDVRPSPLDLTVYFGGRLALRFLAGIDTEEDLSDPDDPGWYTIESRARNERIVFGSGSNYRVGPMPPPLAPSAPGALERAVERYMQLRPDLFNND